MSIEVTFWSAIGPCRQKILNILIGAALVFSILPVFFDEEMLMGLYALTFGLYAIGDWILAIFQLIRREISGSMFIYRLWHGFIVMIILLMAFMLGGLAMTIYR